MNRLGIPTGIRRLIPNLQNRRVRGVPHIAPYHFGGQGLPESITVSLVIPVYSGSEFLKEMVTAQEALRDQWKADPSCPFRLVECIFVLDEPIDNSAEILEGLRVDRPMIRVVSLSKNFGQHPATIAGILHSSGDWIATLDEDLQHDPARVTDLLSAATGVSSDIAYARPQTKTHESLFRDLSSRSFKAIIAWFVSNKNIKVFNSFRLVRGTLARAAASVCSHETYFDIALSWFSSRIVTVEFPMKDRRFIETKKSGYSLGKLLSHARRMAVSSRIDTTKYLMLVSAVATILSLGGGIYLGIQKLVQPDSTLIQGWTSLMVTTTLIGGLILFLVSLGLEYLSSLLLQSQGKPTFFPVDRSGDLLARRYFGGRASADL